MSYTIEEFEDHIETYPNRTSPLENNLGFTLEIYRPTWFKEDIHEMPIFTGKSEEEVLIKICKYCKDNLTWKKDDTKVDLLNYWVPINGIIIESEVTLTMEDIYDYIIDTKRDFYFRGTDCCFKITKRLIL